MKVLQVETIYGAGGISQIVLSLMDTLKKEGHDCRFAFGRTRFPVPEERLKETYLMQSKHEVMLHGIMSRLFDRSGFYSTSATKRLIKYIEEYKPDIIHLHSLLGYYINVKTLFNYLSKVDIPVVWTHHDCWAFTGRCIHFINVGCEKWKTGCHHCPELHSYPESIFIDNSKKNYLEKKKLFTSVKNMTMVAPSRWLGNFIEQSFLRDYPVKVIPNGIDLDVYKPTNSKLREEYGIGKKNLLLGVASTWAPTKGLDFLFELSFMLDPDKYTIVTIGLSEEQIAKAPKGVIALKRTNNIEELVKWFSAADMFLNPTLADNFPTVNLEALACGTPVITFPTGGSGESVGDCGTVTENKTAKDLLLAIKSLEEKKVPAEKCRERAMLYEKNARYLDYIDLYKEILGLKQ